VLGAPALELYLFLFLLLFVLVSPIVSYIPAVLHFPDPLPAGMDPQAHDDQNSHWFFALARLLPLIDAVDTALKGPEHLAAQGTIYPVTILLLFGLNVTAAATRNPRFHAFFAVFFLVYILAFIAINLRMLAKPFPRRGPLCDALRARRSRCGVPPLPRR